MVWLHMMAAVAVAAVLALFLITFIWRWCFRKQPKELGSTQKRISDLQVRIPKGNQAGSPYLYQSELDRGSLRAFRHGVSSIPLFNWDDHPSLVTDVVENGWSRFGFTGYMNSSVSTRSPLLGICSSGDHRREKDVEISWEVSPESTDYMQKIRLNPGLKKAIVGNPSLVASSVIRTALPLPGPHLGNISFPQEAFFEITVLHISEEDNESVNGKKGREGERTKLIQDYSKGKQNSESLVHISSITKFEELKIGCKDVGRGRVVNLSIGLTAGGALPLKLPGTYPGSIGFNSNGSVYLDGSKLVFDSERDEWGRTDKVIGCGFDPRQKKVFFTIDSELMHEFHCKSEEFGYPLYPTLAANVDITVLVNLGQSVFKYAPANVHRTSNPCFVNPLANSPPASLGYEDSRELFSMGRIDSNWLDRITNGSHSTGTVNRGRDFEDESEADLFEIVLDDSGRTP